MTFFNIEKVGIFLGVFKYIKEKKLTSSQLKACNRYLNEIKVSTTTTNSIKNYIDRIYENYKDYLILNENEVKIILNVFQKLSKEKIVEKRKLNYWLNGGLPHSLEEITFWLECIHCLKYLPLIKKFFLNNYVAKFIKKHSRN